MKKLILLLPLILTSCGSAEHEWAWYILSPNKVNGLTNLKFLLSGMGLTIYISVISIIISMFLGLFQNLGNFQNIEKLTPFGGAEIAEVTSAWDTFTEGVDASMFDVTGLKECQESSNCGSNSKKKFGRSIIPSVKNQQKATFLDLAKDTHTHCHLLSTELLSGLVTFLSHEDEQVIEIASECLKLLALEKPNHQVLYAQPTLVSVLTRLTGSTHQTTKRKVANADPIV